MTTANKRSFTIEIYHVVSLGLAALITALCLGQMEVWPVMKTYWWLSFAVINAVYISYGIKKGRCDSGFANGFAIFAGPFAFYTWMFINAYEKYKKR